MLNILRSGEMVLPAHDELALGYRRVRTGAGGVEWWRELPGLSFAFTIAGTGVGKRLGLDVDEVTAASVRRVYRNGTTFEMRHAAGVAAKLWDVSDLQWALVQVKEESLGTLAGGLLTISPAARAATAPRPTTGRSGIYIYIDRRP